jgi:hypothetical protein
MRLSTYVITLDNGQIMMVSASNIVAAHRAVRENGYTPRPGGTRIAR